MFLRKKKRNLLPKNLRIKISNKAAGILKSEYGNAIIPLSDFMCNIINGQGSIDDVLEFADEYGCTVDYLFGRTDTPYYTM